MLRKIIIVFSLLIGFVYAQETIDSSIGKISEDVAFVSDAMGNDNSSKESVFQSDAETVIPQNSRYSSRNDYSESDLVSTSSSMKFLDNASEGMRNVCTCCTLLFLIYLITALI